MRFLFAFSGQLFEHCHHVTNSSHPPDVKSARALRANLPQASSRPRLQPLHQRLLLGRRRPARRTASSHLEPLRTDPHRTGRLGDGISGFAEATWNWPSTSIVTTRNQASSAFTYIATEDIVLSQVRRRHSGTRPTPRPHHHASEKLRRHSRSSALLSTPPKSETGT